MRAAGSDPVVGPVEVQAIRRIAADLAGGRGFKMDGIGIDLQMVRVPSAVCSSVSG